MTPKRIITPHKGGRTKQVHILATSRTKERLVAMAKHYGITAADLFARLVNAEWAERFHDWTPGPPAKEEGRSTDNSGERVIKS